MSGGPAATSGRGSVSPDQLDRLLTLIRPRLWIVLAALLVLVALLVAWGFLGTVRETVPGKGVLQRGQGLGVVQTPVAGRLTDVAATIDRSFRRGDPLATVTGSDGSRTVLRAPFDGRVIDDVDAEGAIVAVGERLFSLEPTSGKLTAILAVAVDRRSELYEGAAVQVRPSSAGETELGYAHGRIERIDPYPASDDELQGVFGSQRMVAQVAGEEAVYVVHVEMSTDPSGRLEWSTPTGSGASIQPGQLTDAEIVVSEGSVVDQVFP